MLLVHYGLVLFVEFNFFNIILFSNLNLEKILAEINFMDSAIKFRQQQYLKGVMDFKKAWSYFKECDSYMTTLFGKMKGLNEIPQLANIRCVVDFGVGMYHFMCSVVPKHFQFIVEGIGFKADRALAMEELKRSMRCEVGIRCKIIYFKKI